MDGDKRRLIPLVTQAYSPLTKYRITTLTEQTNRPATYKLSCENLGEPKTALDTRLTPCEGTFLSPNQERALFTFTRWNRKTGREEIVIDIWNIPGLDLERRFIFQDLARSTKLNCHGDQEGYCFREGCFLDNDHIVLCLSTGHVRVLSIPDGEVWPDKRLGGLVNNATCSEDHVIFTLFPGYERKYYEACGLKIYSIHTIIRQKTFTPIDFVNAESLSILPNKIQFKMDGTEILCRGARMEKKGYINTIEIYELQSRKTRLLYRKQEADQTHEFSNFSDKGHNIITDKDELRLYNENHELIGTTSLPDDLKGGYVDSYISPRADIAFLLKRGDLFRLDTRSMNFERLPGYSNIYTLHFLSNDRLLVQLDMGDIYDLAFFDTEPLNVVKHLENECIIEPVISNGYDITLGGTLVVADREGYIRVFDSSLINTRRIESEHGILRKVLADPFEDRVALLSCTQAVMMYYPGQPRPELHVGMVSRKPIEHGSEYKNIIFSTLEKSHLFMLNPKAGFSLTLDFDGVRTVFANKGSGYVEICDYIRPEFKRVALLELKSPVMDTTELMGLAFLLLENGDLITLDPFEPQSIRIRHDGSILKKGDWHTTRVICRIRNPLGISRIPDNRLAVRTCDSVFLLELSEGLAVLSRKGKELKGIEKIQYDRTNDRFVAAFSHHLGFFTTDFNEMFRLYILPKGKHLIHVPYPDYLKTGLNKDHPGYFWSNMDCYHLFEVLDTKGEVIQDENLKKVFLDNYFNEFMVREAGADYEQFCRNLTDSRPALEGSSHMVRLLPMKGITPY